jgi:hypothetical protein
VKKIVLALTALLSLFLGGLIYIMFRSPALLMFQWPGLTKPELPVPPGKLPAFIIYNLPQGLCLIFCYILIYIIWGKNTYYYLYTVIITLISIAFEISQIYSIAGTFDSADLLVILITFIAALLIYNRVVLKKQGQR